jgi:sterol 3beta-glucosyltransferase
MANPGKSLMVSPIPFMAHPIDHLTPFGGQLWKVMNRLSFWTVNTIKAIVLKRVSGKYQKDYTGLKITVSLLKKAMLEKEKTLYTISPSLFSRPAYWPVPANVVGYFEHDKTANWKPDEALLAFLEKHKKIVFITFGRTNSNPKEKSRMIVDVLKRNNIAAIINTCWGSLEETDEIPDNIHFVNTIPYDWIFLKRMPSSIMVDLERHTPL